jgi:hypothetical protein
MTENIAPEQHDFRVLQNSSKACVKKKNKIYLAAALVLESFCGSNPVMVSG